MYMSVTGLYKMVFSSLKTSKDKDCSTLTQIKFKENKWRVIKYKKRKY